MKILLSLRYGDFKEMKAGVAAIVRILGWVGGARAMAFATRRHVAAIRSGEGLYPEEGKQRVWFKLHYLTLNHLWKEMIPKDTNIVSEAYPPKGNSASMRVTRCFINEVSRDIGLLPVADRLCYGDYLFWENYHPNITFSSTQTPVDGDPVCDHTVTWTD